MPLKAMYNDIAQTYNAADLFGSITESHLCAITQIKTAQLGQRPHFKVLDFGVGNGTFLKHLRDLLPHADFTGIDLSPKMLALASKAVDLTAIETSATEASHYLPHHSQDLVLAHFINAYIPIQTLFNQATLLTRANGYFSLITSTYESFPVGQKLLADFIAKDSVFSRIVGHYYKNIAKNTTVAAGEEELLQTFKHHGFEIVQHQRLYIPIVLNNLDELAQFGIDGTWFLNSLSTKLIPKQFLLERLRRLVSKICTFPYHDTHVIDVVLAKK